MNFLHKYLYLDIEKELFQKILIENCKKFPIKTTLNEEVFISKFEQILSLKQADPQADTSALEKEIDQLVYELYGLTEEEIRVVEGA